MKKGKLIILIAAFLSLSLLFVACKKPQEGSETDTATPEAVKPEDMTIADAEEQDTAKYEIHNYFDLKSDKEDPAPSAVSRIEGDLVSYDRMHNLAVICEKDLDLQNMVTETWKVYDLATDTVIHTETVTNAYKAEATQRTNLSVTVQYPVIRVSRSYNTGVIEENGESEYTFNVSYYLARDNGGMALHTTEDTEFNIYNYSNGLVCVELGDKMFWIDKNLEVVRSIETIFANGYDVEGFDSEYKGYLYSYDDEELLIFNREGKVSATYKAGKDSRITVSVLGNGNALVQELTSVTIYDSYDFVLRGERYTVKSSIIDFITGATEEVDIDFLVTNLTSSYWQERNEPEDLILKNADNFGYVYNFANGCIAKSASLCVLDNSLNKLFTLKNENYGVDFAYGTFAIRDDLYIATVNTDGREYAAIFNLKGELISYINNNVTFTDKYIVSDTTVYDYNMNPVFDIEGSGMSVKYVTDDTIYLSYNNFKTGAVEYYVIRSDSKSPELLADGVNYRLVINQTGRDCYVLYDVERDAYVAYNDNGEELIVSYEPFFSINKLENVMLFRTTFNGEAVVYVVK